MSGSGKSISGERIRAVRALFDAAVALPDDQRDAFLTSADPQLRSEVERLLDAATTGERIFESGPTAARRREEFFTQLRATLEGKYTIERELGRGGMATVFLAQDLRHVRPVALKVLHPEIASGVGLDRFQREIRFAARLQHPHILPVHESGHAARQSGGPTLLWYTMPYVEGESLRDRLRRETQLPVADALHITREVANALEYAHQRGVIHRDIKPENILLSSGHALVADFGIARAVNDDDGTTTKDLTATGAAIGTVAYMSPEQSSGEHRIDPRTDQYSLACVLYEMLAGEPPFTGPTAQMVITRRFTESPRPLRQCREGLPVPIERAVATALSKVPADRFSSVAEFSKALVLPPVEDVPVAVAPRAPRRRTPVIATAFSFLVALALFLAWRFAWSDPNDSLRLAVLPFENVGDSGDVYWANGVADDIRGRLAAIGFQVIGRRTSDQFFGTTKSLREVAEELDVRYLVTGTVRWIKTDGAQRVQVRPELLEVGRSGAPLARWSAPFDAPLDDAFQVQANISGQIASALRVTIAPAAAPSVNEKPTTNLAAWDEFLRGENDYYGSSGFVSLGQALVHYERAVKLDSTFARAWGRLAQVRSSQFVGNPTPENDSTARHGVDRVMQLAPNLPEAFLAKGLYHTLVLNEYAQAIAAFDSGLARSPSHAELLGSKGLAAQGLGDYDRAIEHMRAGLALDPKSVLHVRRLTRALNWRGRLAEAEEQAAQALALNPSDASSIQYAAMVKLSAGDLLGGQEYFRSFPPSADSLVLIAYWAANPVIGMWALPEEQRRLVMRLPRNAFRERSAWAASLASVAWGLGDSTTARVFADSALIELDRLRVKGSLRTFLLAILRPRSPEFLEAIRADEQEVLRLATDGYAGPGKRQEFVLACLIAGQYEKALTHLEALMQMPFYYTPAWLRIDPTFLPIRRHPRFQALLTAR